MINLQHPLQDYPLVSCLCVTWKKVEKLKRTMDCFRAQTYPNKELVIIYEDIDLETSAYLDEFEEEGISCYKIPSNPKLSLGELRNISIERCTGEYFCQWDDDDYYHEDRLKTQVLAALVNHHPVSLLTNWIIYDELQKQAYFSMFRLWEGTILCKKSEVLNKIHYPAQVKQEDTFFINALIEESKIFPTVSPNMYIYVYHGKNTWEFKHFEMLFLTSQKLSDQVSQLIGDILDGKYTVREASELLNSQLLLSEVNYFARKQKKAQHHRQTVLQ